MVVLTSHQSRKQKDERDAQHMGRWAVLTIGTSNKEVARSGRVRIVTAYRVNATDSGDNSTLNQQRKVLALKGRDVTPQKAFDIDIEQQMSSYHAQGDGIILTGDFNCPLGERLLQNLTQKFGLVDVMSRLMAETPPTRDSGSQTITHILVSTTIVN